MKKFGVLLFLLFLVSVCTGTTIRTVMVLPKNGGARAIIKAAKDSLQEKNLSENALCHDQWIDWYGGVQRIAGVKVIPNTDRTVYRMQDGSVCFFHQSALRFTEKEEERIRALKAEADRLGAQSWFVSIPRKACTQTYSFASRGVTDPMIVRTPVYRSTFVQSGYKLLDLHEAMHAQGLGHSTLYYRTDHHWTTRTAFWAAGEIAAALGLDASALDIGRFKSENYETFFLGSEGKRCGRLYCEPDDLEILIPQFSTDFSVFPFADPGKASRGEFADDISPYQNNAYTVFLGGDESRTIVNHMLPDGVHIVCIKDSFTNSMAPFLALLCGQIDLIDPRNDTQPLDSVLSEQKPDHFVVTMTPCMGNGYFDLP